MVADRIVRRCRSNTFGQTTRLAMPLSSSSVMNITPLALPGRCRTSTRPAASSQRPSRACHRLDTADDPAAAEIRRAGRRQGGCAATGSRGDSPRRPRRQRSSAAGAASGSSTSGTTCASRAEAAAKSGNGSSRSALIAQRASRRARDSPGRKPSASAIRVSAATGTRSGATASSTEAKGASARAATIAAPCTLARPFTMQKPKPDREPLVVAGRLEGAVPPRGIDADRAYLDPMILRVPNDLGRRIEAHRLAVQQGRAEDLRMPAFQPCGGIGDQRERGCVAFGKAVGAEALELPKGLLGELELVAVRHHAGDQLVPERRHPAGELEGRHRLAQHVGFARREAGAFDGDPHRLLLEQRHAERLAEHLLQFGRWDSAPASSPRGGADRDAPCRPGSARAGRSPPGRRGRRRSGASAAAASTSARGSRSGRCRACRPCGSSHRCADPRPGWWPDRERSPCARREDRSPSSCRSACQAPARRPS